MNSKVMIWGGMFVGSTIGGMIPSLWGADLFSFSPILLSAVGAFVGIWAGFKISQMVGS